MRNIRNITSLLLAVLLAICALPALAVQADTVTKQCTFKVDPGESKPLTDGDLDTVWHPSGNDAKLTINLPANGAGYVVIEWADVPTGYVFTQYDAQQGPISSVNQADAYGGMTQVLELDESARSVMLNLTRKGQRICEVSVYSAGELPADIARWSAPYVKTDIMLVCAYPGDEFVTFGGLLPYYAIERENRVQPVYMTYTNRTRKLENQAALWSLGMTNHPIYLNLSADKAGSLEDCLSLWGGKNELIGVMVATIRECKPEVIVSHNLDSADPRRKLTAMLMQYAVDAAADPNQYPESAETYGIWHVKKLYLLGEDEHTIDFDWNVPSPAMNGATYIEAAALAFSEYESLRGNYAVTEAGEGWDTSVYGLKYSMIGDDTRHDCFFENVPALDTYVENAATAEPTAEPTMVPALVFSPEPTAETNAQGGTVDEFSANSKIVLIVVCVGVGIILLISCIQALIYHNRGRGRRRY